MVGSVVWLQPHHRTNHKILILLGIEPRLPDRPVCSLVTIPSELFTMEIVKCFIAYLYKLLVLKRSTNCWVTTDTCSLTRCIRPEALFLNYELSRTWRIIADANITVSLMPLLNDLYIYYEHAQ